MIDAESIAISVPLSSDIPTFAWSNAGESFIPSPTNATFLPDSFTSLTILSLSSGRTESYATSIPNSSFTLLQTLKLSPDNKLKYIFFSFNKRIVSFDDSFILSLIVIIPISLLS